jgi:hypothetical protein
MCLEYFSGTTISINGKSVMVGWRDGFDGGFL